MKSKTRKSEELSNLKSKFPDSKITVFTSFAKEGEKGLSVSQMQALKRLLRELSAEYLVTKKTIIDLATKGLKYDGLDPFSMKGSLGLIIGKGDPYETAKKAYDFSKTNPAFQFWGAIFENNFLGKDAFMEIARLPSKEVLIGQLLGMLTYPVRGLAIALSEIAKNRN